MRKTTVRAVFDHSEEEGMTRTDITYWCEGNHRERLMERFRGDMMVESHCPKQEKGKDDKKEKEGEKVE